MSVQATSRSEIGEDEENDSGLYPKLNPDDFSPISPRETSPFEISQQSSTPTLPDPIHPEPRKFKTYTPESKPTKSNSPTPNPPTPQPPNENKISKEQRHEIRRILDLPPGDLYQIAKSGKLDPANKIKSRLMKSSLLIHPDKVHLNYTRKATRAQALVNEARNILLDKKKRANFDKNGYSRTMSPKSNDDKKNADFFRNAWDEDSELDSDSDEENDNDGNNHDDDSSPPDAYIKKVYAKATLWVKDILVKGQTFNQNPTGKKPIQWTESVEFQTLQKNLKTSNDAIKAHNKEIKVDQYRHCINITPHLSNRGMADRWIKDWEDHHTDELALRWIIFYYKEINKHNKAQGYPLEWNFRKFNEHEPRRKNNEEAKQTKKGQKNQKKQEAENEEPEDQEEDQEAENNESKNQEEDEEEGQEPENKESESQEMKPVLPGYTLSGERIVGKLPRKVYSSYEDSYIISDCKFFVETELQNLHGQTISDIELRTDADIGFEAARKYLADISEDEQISLLEIFKHEKGKYKRSFEGITGVTAREFETPSFRRLPPTYVRAVFRDESGTYERFITRTTLRMMLGKSSADQVIQQYYAQYDEEVKQPPWPKCLDYKPTQKLIRSRQDDMDLDSEDGDNPANNKIRGSLGQEPKSQDVDKIAALTKTVEKLQQESEQKNRLIQEAIVKAVNDTVTAAMAQLQQQLQGMNVGGNQTSH